MDYKAKYITFNPILEHKYTLIFLHGLGASAMGFYDLFLDQSGEYKIVPPTCRVVLPSANM